MERDPFPLPSRSLMLLRGLVRHCPRCNSGHLFRGWFSMVPRCPRCGMCFEREEGFFLGAFVVNFGVMLISLALFITIGVAVTLPDPSAIGLAAGGMLVGTLVPIAFYPFSRTFWSAIDLWMKPLEPDEVASASSAIDR